MSTSTTVDGRAEDVALTAGTVQPDVYARYQQIKDYEHHFNTIQIEIRKLASAWLLATLAAVAFLVRQSLTGSASEPPPEPLIEQRMLISMACAMGTAGLLVLWILDQLVYHRLLQAVFLVALRLEYAEETLPPIRNMMMLFAEKRGLSKTMSLYYSLPMSVLAILSVYAVVWFLTDVGVTWKALQELPTWVAFGLGVLSVLMPAGVWWKSKGLEDYASIAREFTPVEGQGHEFQEYLDEKAYELVVRRNLFPKPREAAPGHRTPFGFA